jgi:hypothetical protein
MSQLGPCLIDEGFVWYTHRRTASACQACLPWWLACSTLCFICPLAPPNHAFIDWAPFVPPSPQPCFIFVGEAFENDPALKQVRSLLLDCFRGRQVGVLLKQRLPQLLPCSAIELCDPMCWVL